MERGQMLARGAPWSRRERKLEGGRRSPGRLPILALLLGIQLLLVLPLVQLRVTGSGNEASRFATVERLLDAHTFAIDRSPFLTVDRVRVGGHYYSDKPLLLSVAVAALDWPLTRLFDLSFHRQRSLLVYLSTALAVTVWLPVLTILLYGRLVRAGLDRRWALAGAALLPLSSWVLPYATTLTNHVPAAIALFGLLMLLERLEADGGGRLRGALAAGVLCGLLAALEIPTGGVFLLVGIALLASRGEHRRARTLAWIAGFLIVLGLEAVIDVLAYGNPLPAYLVPGAFDFPGNVHTQRIAGLHRPADLPAYLWGMTFGLRGFFSYMPWLLLGPVWLWQQRRMLPRLELACAAAALALFAFYGTQTGDFGGWAYGFRFLVPMVPLFGWWALRWALPGGRGRRALIGLLLAVGLATSLVGAWNPWPVIYEGAATLPGSVEQEVHSPLLANLLVHSFARDRQGALFATLSRHYGRELTLRYLHKAIYNLRRGDLVPPLHALAREWQLPLPPPY